MGTTMVATLVAADAAQFTYGHVGDSCLYIFRGGRATQLTRDDSLANSVWANTEEGSVVGAMKNVLTKALGVRGEVDFDVAGHDLVPGDTVASATGSHTELGFRNERRPQARPRPRATWSRRASGAVAPVF